MFARLPHWGIVILMGSALAAPLPALAQRVDEPGASVGRALQQPFRDLNIVRTHTAQVLSSAADNPYDRSGLDSCATVSVKLDELGVALGPDIDVDKHRGETNTGEALAAGAVDSVVGLPFSGLIRRLTGAHSRDVAHRRAVLAGMVRRGYLTGIWRTMGCDAPQGALAAAPVAPQIDTTALVPEIPSESIPASTPAPDSLDSSS